MQIFWAQGELSTPSVHEKILTSRDVTYSTVKTIVDRLEDKGALQRSQQHGRTIIYAPAIGADAVKTPLVKAFLKNIFGNDRQALFSYLLGQDKLTDQEVEHIRRLLKEHEERHRS